MHNFYTRLQRKKSLLILAAFVSIFGILGTLEILNSRAAEPVTLSGRVFEDVNRNSAFDIGEKPMANIGINFCDNVTKTSCSMAVTDANGFYSKSGLIPSNYTVEVSTTDWGAIYDDLTPTTTGKLTPEFTQDISTSKTFNFGFRSIYYSADISNYTSSSPVSTYTPVSGGPIVNVYNDAISAEEVYNRLARGALIGKEALTTTIYYGTKNSWNFTGYSINGSEENCIDSNVSTDAAPVINFKDSFGKGGGAGTADNVLFHEYGHAWSLQWACAHGDPFFTEYLELRGLTGNPLLGSSHAWSKDEIIAEDYRQLFGNPTAAAGEQENRDITLAKDVPGLKDYLMTTFMMPKGDTSPTAPSNLTASNSSSVEGASVQLNWTASTDNTGVKNYLIYSNNQLIDIVNSPTTTFANTNLKFNTTYTFYVKASDRYGNLSPPSNIVTITTPPGTTIPPPDTTPPSPPTGLASTTVTGTSIGLKWNASTDNKQVTGYRVYRTDGRKANPVLMAVISGTSYTAAGLKRSTSYSFYVQAIDAAGNASSPSGTITVKTTR